MQVNSKKILEGLLCFCAFLLIRCTPRSENNDKVEISNQNIVLSDSGARVFKIAENVYSIIHDDATPDWPHGNTGVVIGKKGVLVFDATYLPSRARADIKLIKSLTDKQVLYLVYSHWHFDHNNGGMAYQESFPNIKIISEKESQKLIDLNGVFWSKMSSADSSPRRKVIYNIENELASGKDAAGATLSDSIKKEMRYNLNRYKEEIAELKTIKIVKPTDVFTGSMKLDLGDEEVEITDQGMANSPHDVTLYLPKEKILFTGDILVQHPFAYVYTSFPMSWIPVLKKIEAMQLRAIVPGHGPIFTDKSYVTKVRDLLETTANRVEKMIRDGKNIDEIQKTIDLSDLRTGVWDESQSAREAFNESIPILVELVWRGLRGKG